MKPLPPLITPRQWSELQAAATVIGIRAAARAFAQAFPEPDQRALVDRIRKHATRHRWRIPQLNLVAPPAPVPAPAMSPVVPDSLAPAVNQARESGPGSSPASRNEPALVTGAAMIASILAKRRERSGLYLSHYLVSATRSLAGSRGDLDQADRAASLARTRQALWPEQSAQAGSEMAVQFDDAGKVAAIHSRLVVQLTGSLDPRLAGNQQPEAERGARGESTP